MTWVQNHLIYANFDQKLCKYADLLRIVWIFLVLTNLMIHSVTQGSAVQKFAISVKISSPDDCAILKIVGFMDLWST